MDADFVTPGSLASSGTVVVEARPVDQGAAGGSPRRPGHRWRERIGQGGRRRWLMCRGGG